MQNYQYVIKQRSNDTFVSWCEDVILFDTQEEAEELITEYALAYLFEFPMNVEICKGLFFITKSINYKQLKDLDVFRQMCKLYSSTPDYIFNMKEENQNG